MKKTFLYIGVGFFAFLISLAVVFFLASRNSYDLETARNICQRCLDVLKTEFLETKTISDIISDKSFQGKKVRLQARLRHDAGFIFLHELNNESRSVPVRFAESAIPCWDTEKTLQVCTGYKTWYDHSVDVVVVGYLGKIYKDDNQFQEWKGKDGFNIICVEQVIPTEEELKIGKAKFEKYKFPIIGW